MFASSTYIYYSILQWSLGPSFWCSPTYSCWQFSKKAQNLQIYIIEGILNLGIWHSHFSVSFVTQKKYDLLLVFQFFLGHILFLSVYSLLLHWEQRHENAVFHKLLGFCTTWMKKVHLGSHPFNVLQLDSRNKHLNNANVNLQMRKVSWNQQNLLSKCHLPVSVERKTNCEEVVLEDARWLVWVAIAALNPVNFVLLGEL